MCKLVGRTAGHGRNDPRIRRAYAGETNAMLPVGQKCPTSVLPATRGPRWRVECWLAIIAIEPAVSLQRDHTWRRTLALIGEFKVENGPRFGAVLRVVLKVVLEVDFGTLRRPLSATQTEFQFLATRRISTQHLSLREQYV